MGTAPITKASHSSLPLNSHTMSTPRVLLLGGHGKVSMLLTPLVLARSWHVTSVVRNPEHRHEILALAKQQDDRDRLEVLVSSLEDVKTAADAKKVIDQAKPDYIVWLAGAGGKGGAARTFAIDRDAAKAYIEAGVSEPRVKKFLLVSYIASRRGRPSWWTDEDWSAAQKVNTEVLKNYFEAKVEADEFLVAHAEKRRRGGDESFQYIDLRPDSLTDDSASGNVIRADVADVAARLLERDDTRGYYDFINGD